MDAEVQSHDEWMPKPLPQPRKWRWRFAFALDKLMPSLCWSHLVDWVYGPAHYTDPEERPRLRHSKQASSCIEDAERCGSCYCGKVRRGR